MSAGMISAARTSPSRTFLIASSRDLTGTGSIASNSGLASLETSTFSPPRSTTFAELGTSFRNATLGLPGPLVTAKPTSAAMMIG